MLKKSAIIIFILSAILILMTSCLSDMIVLTEVGPKGKGGKKDGKEEKKPPVTAQVLEIEEVAGVQKYFYLKLGKKNEGIANGLKGYIYNDISMATKIGKFQLIEVYYDYSKGKILELNYKIAPNAVVSIEVDPENLIE